MMVDENSFFRQATLLICGNLNFEIALQDCLLYLKSFMPAERLHLNLYDRGLGALRTIAFANEKEARRADIVLPLDEKGKEYLDDPKLPPAAIWNRVSMNPVAGPIVQLTGQSNYSSMVLHLAISGARLGNLVLHADGIDRYTEDYLRLFSVLYEPFAIALSNTLRFDELKQLKDFMADDIRYLRAELKRFSVEDVIGENLGLRRTMEMVRKVSPLDSPVLLQGETGAGKEVIAKATHHLSHRKDGPFIQVNCGAIPDTLIDSELFGHEKGSFTGAISQMRGCFERANGGTIFLDEIGELPLEAQVRMLRVLQDKYIQRVGGTAPIRVDIRIIAATHQDLQEMIRKNLFRPDLWFRLNVFPIVIPPLRDRKEDIPALVNHFIQKKSKEMQISTVPKLVAGAMRPLLEYSWPGNVRELENVLERALILRKGPLLSFENIVWPNEGGGEKMPSVEQPSSAGADLDHVVASHIKETLRITKGKVHGPHGAAELLKIKPSTLRYRMKRLGIPYGRGVQY
jgi:transcriptional regulator with GAF, ATPase, and Fis domain